MSLYNVRDNSWAPSSAEVPEDPQGADCRGRFLALVKRPEAFFTKDCFEVRTKELPEALMPETVLVKVLYLSMDPTHAIWTKLIPQYMPAVGLNTAMRCLGIFEVVKSADESRFPIGFIGSGFTGIGEYSVLPFTGVNPAAPGAPVTWNVGPFSLIQGHTAWVGYKICDVKAGDTVVVSGAHGAVGSLAGQLAKSKGAYVVGIAGGPEKCKAVVDDFGFDACIDYKGSESIVDGLKRLCPKGIDSYLDNVGGSTLDAVLLHIKTFGRIAVCGGISEYANMGEKANGIKNWEMILMRRVTVQGYVVVDHLASVGEAMAEIGALAAAGKLVHKEDVRECDIADYVDVVNNLFTGGNKGKLIMKLK